MRPERCLRVEIRAQIKVGYEFSQLVGRTLLKQSTLARRGKTGDARHIGGVLIECLLSTQSGHSLGLGTYAAGDFSVWMVGLRCLYLLVATQLQATECHAPGRAVLCRVASETARSNTASRPAR